MENPNIETNPTKWPVWVNPDYNPDDKSGKLEIIKDGKLIYSCRPNEN